MRSRHFFFWLVVSLWCYFLALQWGDAVDESEHAHTAWLMGHLHKSPPADFFQHHQPLLWHVLELYYLAGFNGPEVIYWGRMVVVGCALVFCFGIRALARKRTLPADLSVERERRQSIIGIVPMVALCIVFRTMFTIRPETLSLALFVLSAVCWVSRRTSEEEGASFRKTWGKDFLVGVLFGAAVYASPRFLLLSGAFLILPRGRERPAYLGWSHVAAVVGAAGFIVGYARLTDYNLSDILFNIQFTRTLAGLGDGYFRLVPWWLVSAVVFALACAWVMRQLTGPARTRFLLQTVYLGLVTAASFLSAWPYLHVQAFIPAAVWLCVMFALAAGEIDWIAGRLRRLLAPVLASAAAFACWLAMTHAMSGGATVVMAVQIKHKLLELLREGDTVMMAAAAHPICVADASYYCLPITDGEQRLSRAVAMTMERWRLPACDHLRDIIQQKPAIIDGHFLRDVLSEADRKVLQQLLESDYQAIPWTVSEPGLLFQTLYFRIRDSSGLLTGH